LEPHPIKLKYVGTTNSKPLGPIIMFGQSKTRSIIQIIFITLFSSSCATLLLLLPALKQTDHTCRKLNYFPELNWYIKIFLHLILMWRVTYWAWVGLLLEISYLHSPIELWICLELQIYAPFNFILEETIVGSLWLQKTPQAQMSETC